MATFNGPEVTVKVSALRQLIDSSKPNCSLAEAADGHPVGIDYIAAVGELETAIRDAARKGQENG